MAVTDRPWDGNPGRWADAESYCASALIDENPSGEPKTKTRCSLPVTEPDSGAINRNALVAAYAALRGARGGVRASPEAKRRAARRLVRLYREAELEVPEPLRRLAD